MRRVRVVLVVVFVGLGLVLTLFPGLLHWNAPLDKDGLHAELRLMAQVTTELSGQATGGAAHRRRYLLYHCNGKDGLCGGWADRVKGMVAGYLIAMATNRTFAINITSPPCVLTDFLRPNKVRWDVLPAEEELRGLTRQTYNAMDTDNFFQVLRDSDLDRVLPSPVVQFRANYEYADSIKGNAHYTCGPWKWTTNLTNAQLYATVMEELFSLAPPLQEELEDFLMRARPSPKHRLVCAHMRMGRNPTNPRDFVIRGNQNDVNMVLDFLEKRAQEEANTRIFMATDSADVRDKARQRLGGRLWLMNGTVAHVERATGDQDACLALRTVLLEQRVLSRCDALLISFSGLGRHAAYLRRRDDDLFCLVRGQILPCTPPQLRSLYRVKG